MRTTLVHIHVKAENVEDFIVATQANHEGSAKEEGNIAFDVLQSAEDPGYFVLRELFEDEAAVNAHKETEHYKLWRDSVKDWMAETRRGEIFHQLCP